MDLGFTLLECLVVLVILGVGLALGTPALQDQRDRWAVLQAREASAALFSRARAEAVGSGDSDVSIREVTPLIERHLRGVPRESLQLDARFGVSLDLSGTSSTVVISFDALGLGRIASRTLRFTRSDAASLLIVSSYGRVARR